MVQRKFAVFIIAVFSRLTSRLLYSNCPPRAEMKVDLFGVPFTRLRENYARSRIERELEVLESPDLTIHGHKWESRKSAREKARAPRYNRA